jgi:hypothetical protein
LELAAGEYKLYDEGHDLVDALDCSTQMIVAMDPLTHARDEVGGIAQHSC